MEKQKNIPTLRFPEFKGEWETLKLEEILFEGKLGGNYENSESNIGIPVIKMGNLGRGDINLDKIQFLPENESYNNDDLLKEGDLLFNTRNTLELVGKVSIWRSELPIALYNSNLMRLKFSFQIESTNRFMNYCFNIKKTIDQLRSYATGTTSVAAIYGKDLKFLKLSFPVVPEQTKIATFLTAIDERLNQLKRKKTLMEQYKKGVMQKIFDQEIRFKPALNGAEGDDEGNEFPDWETTKFGLLYTIKSTNSYSRDNLNYESGEVKNLHYGDIHTRFKPLLDTAKEYIPFINKEIDISKIPFENYCQEGDLVIADASEDYDDIGKAIEVVNLNNERVVAGLHTILAKPDLSKIALGFGAYLMKAEYIHFQIRVISQGTKVLGLSSNRLSEITVNLPCLSEQTKIANFLSAIDEKISLCNKQIAKTELYKKGLFQQMFV